ncbi:hypothetical protein BLNAU_16460 [Blattamonas nauphoetae]|uniref:Uncharacterized protein n=1 Tax=Blattamonas nauphoetae TaxID=2049346 RepID=A0ABQ9XEA6_9EUKA|nr:hypothetical protein BLNAU_16460 [Blattamonas nauphoetae]
MILFLPITIILPSNNLKYAPSTTRPQTPSGTTPDATLTSTSLNISSTQFGSNQGIFADLIQPEDPAHLCKLSVSCSASAFHNISSLTATQDVFGSEFAVNHTTTVTQDMITCNKCKVLAPTVIDCRRGGGMIFCTAPGT